MSSRTPKSSQFRVVVASAFATVAASAAILATVLLGAYAGGVLAVAVPCCIGGIILVLTSAEPTSRSAFAVGLGASIGVAIVAVVLLVVGRNLNWPGA